MRHSWSWGRISVLIAVAVIVAGLALPAVYKAQVTAKRTEDIWNRREVRQR